MQWSAQIKDVGVEGEARVLIKNLQSAARQVGASPREVYAEVAYQLPAKLGGVSYTVRFLPSVVRVEAGGKTYEGSTEVQNAESASGSDSIKFYKDKNSSNVFVRKV